MKKWLIKKIVNGVYEEVNLGSIKYEEDLKLAKEIIQRDENIQLNMVKSMDKVQNNSEVAGGK